MDIHRSSIANCVQLIAAINRNPFWNGALIWAVEGPISVKTDMDNEKHVRTIAAYFLPKRFILFDIIMYANDIHNFQIY